MNPLLPGTIVHYHPREGERGAPGIVIQQWPDGAAQLYVFHFDAGTNIRSAHPAEFDVVLSPSALLDVIERFDQISRRLTDLEEQMEAQFQSRLIPYKRTEPLQVDASMIDETLLTPLVLGDVDPTPDTEAAPESIPAHTSLATEPEEAPEAPDNNPWKRKRR